MTFQRFAYLVAIRIVCALLNSSDGNVGIVALNSENALLTSWVRNRSRAFAIFRWYAEITFADFRGPRAVTFRELILLFIGDRGDNGDKDDDENEDTSTSGVGGVFGGENANDVDVSLYNEGISADSGVVGNTFGRSSDSVGDNIG